MTDMWLGYAERAARREVLMALRRIAPGSAVVFTRSAHELRERFGEEEPGTVGAIVGHTGDGVSDLNLAAALVHDGLASEVVLVARGASGSLRSRAQRAGVARVVDATVAPTLEAALSRRKLGREVADVAAGHQGAGSEGVADRATPASEATDGRGEHADHADFRAGNQGSGGAVHPQARHPSSGKRPGGDFYRGNRQSLLFHRYSGCAARHRDPRRHPAESHNG